MATMAARPRPPSPSPTTAEDLADFFEEQVRRVNSSSAPQAPDVADPSPTTAEELADFFGEQVRRVNSSSAPQTPDVARHASSEVHTPQDVADSVVLKTGRPRLPPHPSRHKRRLRDRSAYARKRLMTLASRPGPDQDRLLSAAVQLPGAEHYFPETAHLLGNSGTDRQVVENCRELISSAGARHKKAVLQVIAAGLPSSIAKRSLGVSTSALREARRSHVLDDTTIDTDDYKHGTERDKLDPLADSLLRRFFMDTTHVLSGASRETRNLEMRLHEWEAELHGV
jgi:hypothetical protein